MLSSSAWNEGEAQPRVKGPPGCMAGRPKRLSVVVRCSGEASDSVSDRSEAPLSLALSSRSVSVSLPSARSASRAQWMGMT